MNSQHSLPHSPADRPGRRGFSRRRFFAGAAAGTAAAGAAALRRPARAANAGAFRHGVASGDPLPGSVIIWTRVTPTEDAAPGSGLGPESTVGFEVAADLDFRDIVADGQVSTGPGVDHTVHVELTDLQPDTTYFYRFRIVGGPLDGELSPMGRTRTAPNPGDHVEKLTVAFASCTNWEAGFYSPFYDLADRAWAEEIDLVTFLGDYIYEYASGEYPGPRGIAREHEPAHEIVSLADYRARFAKQHTDPAAQEAHGAAPWIVIWDDHEVTNDTWREGAENHDEASQGPYLERRNNAMQAYFEWLPVRATSPSKEGHIYRSLDFGDLAHVSVMDLRTYRDEQPTAFNHNHANGTGPDGQRTILGSEQFQWLADDIRSSRARWNVLANSVMFAPLNLSLVRDDRRTSDVAEFLGPRSAPGIPLNYDQWDGYAADRERLLDVLEEHNAQTGAECLVLTGDIHTEWGNEIYSRRSLLGAEAVCASVTAPNVADTLGLPPGNGISRLAEDVIKNGNHHVRHVNLDAHGYGIARLAHDGVDLTWLRVDDPYVEQYALTPAVEMRYEPGQGLVS